MKFFKNFLNLNHDFPGKYKVVKFFLKKPQKYKWENMQLKWFFRLNLRYNL